ncbi:MAG: hypothetical protein ACI9EF_002223 [Pseudohongiellaceae bacterium]|jgi:hypothetical protein
MGNQPQHHFVSGYLLVVVAISMCVSGCITPPAVLPVGWDDLDLIDYPPGTERVELKVAEGRTLVGVFVSAGRGAPVVVVLPGALESVTLGGRHHIEVGGEPSFSWVNESDSDSDSDSELVEGHLVSERSFRAGVSLGLPKADLGCVIRTTSGEMSRLIDELWDRRMPLTWRLFDSLKAQGLSTLFVDYGGVGASSGELDVDFLGDDAWAIWNEAVARAGGDPARVALRGTSLGSLAVGSLLDRGAKPAAVLLVGPVRGETVAAHFARWTDVPWWQLIALPFFDSVTDVDLVAALDRYSGPLLFLVPEVDGLLPADERALLLPRSQTVGSAMVTHEVGHQALAIAGHDDLPGEIDFYGEAFGPLHSGQDTVEELLAVDGVAATPLADEASMERLSWYFLRDVGRYPSPRLLAALALDEGGSAGADALAPWLARLPPERVAPLDLASCQALINLDDPDGALDPLSIAALATLLVVPAADVLCESVSGLNERLLAMADVMQSMTTNSESAQAKLSGMLDDAPVFTVRFAAHGARVENPVELALWLAKTVADAEMQSTEAEAPALAPERARRRTLRRLLKALGIPDKIAADGTLLALSDGRWQSVTS